MEEDKSSVIKADEKVLPSAVNFIAIHKALYEDFIHLDLTNLSSIIICIYKIISVIFAISIIFIYFLTTTKQF